MPKKKFVLRINEETMRAVEKWAADEFRSVNGQLEWIITQQLKTTGRFRPPPLEGKDQENKSDDPTD